MGLSACDKGEYPVVHVTPNRPRQIGYQPGKPLVDVREKDNDSVDITSLASSNTALVHSKTNGFDAEKAWPS